jgi:lactoylglutathione lyase
MVLKLIVVRTQDMVGLANFYRTLGLTLEYHKHGKVTLPLLNTPFLVDPINTEFGFMAIVSDPDHRKVELYKLD